LSINQIIFVSIGRGCCTCRPAGSAQFRVEVGDVPLYRSDTDEVLGDDLPGDRSIPLMTSPGYTSAVGCSLSSAVELPSNDRLDHVECLRTKAVIASAKSSGCSTIIGCPAPVNSCISTDGIASASFGMTAPNGGGL